MLFIVHTHFNEHKINIKMLLNYKHLIELNLWCTRKSRMNFGSPQNYIYVGDSPHIMIIVLMSVHLFIYTMYNIYTIYIYCSLLTAVY
jgi:hypothetical protein